MKHPIPQKALDDRLAFLGTAGSGKTYNAGGAVERLLSTGARCVIVDPLDVWWGLALTADGKKPSPYRKKNSLIIFGGKHADLPINEHSGALIGETVARMAESCIVSLGGFDTGAAERRFMLAFLDAIYRKAAGSPFHLIVDEADMFAPQKPPKGQENLLNRMEQIVRRGRVKGFVPWLISQRPAVLNKNVLSQADGLVAFKLTASQDRDAIGAWIEGQADKQDGKKILAGLPTMQIGQGIVWIPGRGVLETATFPKKLTFDSSRTPKRGERQRRTAKLKPVDLGALKEKLATITDEKKANDPAALRAENASLKKQLAAKQAAGAKIDPNAIKAAEEAGYNRGWENCADAYQLRLADVFEGVKKAVNLNRIERKKFKPSTGRATFYDEAAPVSPKAIERAKKTIALGPQPETQLPEGERKILTAIVQFDGCDPEQIAVLTGYKATSRRVYINNLVRNGYAEKDGKRIIGTSAGEAALGNLDPLPTGRALQEYWRQNLSEGEWKLLTIAIEAYPKAIPRESFDAAGYKATSLRVYLNRLKARKLLTDAGGRALKAAEHLF